MTTHEIAEAVRFNAELIAQEIDDAVYVQKHGHSPYEKEWAVRTAFWHIHELIFKGDENAE